MQVKHQGMDGSVQKYPYFPTHRSTWHLHLITRASQVPHCFKITASTSLSLKRDRLSAIRNRTIPLFPRQTIDEHGTHDLLAPSSFTRNVFARKQGIARRKQMKRERVWRRNAVVGWFRRTWREVGRRENPLGMELRGGGWRGCTSGEHRGREEASCKEYKQCVLIRAPWPDECTIVALQGFATNPASTRTLAACRSQRSRAPYIRCPAPGRN